MKMDIIKRKDDYAVYPRDKFDGDEYEGEPVFVDEDRYECELWCEDHGHTFRHHRQAILVKPAFVKDVEKKLDKWRSELDEYARRCGRRLESNITYRASAAWKEETTHYCYFGDFGGCASFVHEDKSKADASAFTEATRYFDIIIGAADALWELGLTVTYDKDGKHTIYGLWPEWVTPDNEE